MLVLTRREDETIRIGDDIIVKVVRNRGGRVRLAIEAPRSVPIRRGELSPELPCQKVETERLNHRSES
ncbi:carbon storage regulator [Adhaeretor mobilis]|uniref:Translational regulator CsrA n=1 Tax=Adhaeretor mobilis TaxID=1930276 RepID=A0A517N2I6_9BACT|nr:carbon storage regulator [Adhaeretor mobilis]QDT01347.1 Carbon storage regulator [Adhaeretor mobilis]